MGVALPGVAAADAAGAAGASSDMLKMIVSARLCTRSIGFLASNTFRLTRVSDIVIDMALDEAAEPPTGTSMMSATTRRGAFGPTQRVALTQCSQTLGHQKFKLLIRKDTDILSDALPIWVGHGGVFG